MLSNRYRSYVVKPSRGRSDSQVRTGLAISLCIPPLPFLNLQKADQEKETLLSFGTRGQHEVYPVGGSAHARTIYSPCQSEGGDNHHTRASRTKKVFLMEGASGGYR